MNFGEALEALKKGERVARSGWKDKDQWLAYMVTVGRIILFSAQGISQAGWLIEQVDVLADDWEVLTSPAALHS